MNHKWLLIGMCLLITACTAAKEEPQKKEDPTDGKAAQTDNPMKITHVLNESIPAMQDEDEEEQDADSQDENPIDAIEKKLADARKEFMAAYRKASKEEKQEMQSEYPDASEYIDEVKKIAEDATDDDVAAAAYVWLASNLRGDAESQEEAYDVLLEKYIGSARLKEICMGFSYATPSAKVEERLKKLREESPHEDVKAIASYALASYFQRVEEAKENVDNPRMISYYGEESIEYIKDFDPAEARVEDLLQIVVDKYPDATIGSGERVRNIAEMASATLFEIRHLSVGCEAPDIEGTDIDGVDFKLSDYRGKVVMLDFWGDW